MAWTFGDGLMYTPTMGRPRGSRNKVTGLDKFPTYYALDSTSGCWNWTRSVNNKGYGWFRQEGHLLAHRWSYATFCGAIPDGKSVLHRCDNSRCVNPDHLFLGSLDDNNKDMVAKGRHYSKGKTFEEVYGEEEAARKKEHLSRLRDGKPPLHAMPHSAETKAKISALKKSLPPPSRERVERQRATLNQYWTHPEHHERHSAAVRRAWARRKGSQS